MDPPGSKIKFGFSRIIKKPNLVSQNGESAAKSSKIELIEAIEGSAIKITGKNPEDEVKSKLVIPMTNDQKTTPISKLMEERLKHARRRNIKLELNGDNIKVGTDVNPDVEMKQEPVAVEVKQEPIEETLDQQAARELFEDLQAKVVKTEVKVFEVPMHPDDLPLDGAKESSFDDYDRVPIGDFGKAMLRGMGWKDVEGNDESKKIDLDGPILRPKGMGLGADKVVKKQALLIAPNKSETLEIKRHACVKILAGKHKNFYGTIEGFDDGGGRVVVKLAIGGMKVTLNEFMVQPIAKQEFAKYGKILNSAKYEEYRAGVPSNNSSSSVKKTEVINIDDSSPSHERNRSSDHTRRRSRDRSDSRDRRASHKSSDRRTERSEKSSSTQKYRGRSRSREKRSRKHSSSSDDHSIKRKTRKHKKEHSSPDTRHSSDNEKRHKKKSKKSKSKRDRS